MCQRQVPDFAQRCALSLLAAATAALPLSFSPLQVRMSGSPAFCVQHITLLQVHLDEDTTKHA